MSKDRKKLVHIHSNVNDKQPTPTTLELGELGVNNAAGNAFISTKNSNNEVVRFSEDGTIINWMEYKEVIPYEAYVRGSNSAATDVTTDDLANNKSNIVIKLNQVVARNTEYDEKVNGAKDIYGNEINPISADGYKDGAGLAIDMSRYAMIGANPSFSSVTTTCGANLQGKTSVKGSTCGSELDVNVSTIKENATTIDTTACTRNYNNTNDFKVVECTEGQGETQIKSCKKFNVKSNDIVLEQCGSKGETRIKSCSAVTIESKNITLTDGECENGQITIETNGLCLAGNEKVNVYGGNTNVGLDCDDSEIATNTRVFGKGTLITTNLDSEKHASQDNVEIVAAKDIKEDAANDITENANNNIYITANNKFCEKAKDSYLYGVNSIVIGKDCDDNLTPNIIYWRNSEQVCKDGVVGFSAATVDDALDEVYHRSQVSMTSTGNTTGTDVPVPDTGTSIVRSGSTTYTIHQDSDGCDKTYDFTVDNTIVSMSAHTYSADEEAVKKHTFWQYIGDKRVEIGEINVPTCVSYLGRAKLSWTYGSVCDAANDSYDPGSKCDLSTGSTFIIPKTISDVTCGDVVNDSCLEINKSVCVSGDITASRAIYSSDIKLKENIKPIDIDKILKANKVKLKSFNFKDDEEKRETYGVIAQEVEEIGLNELVHLKQDGNLGVDYTSLLILKNAYLENKCEELSDKINRLENEMMILRDFIKQKIK